MVVLKESIFDHFHFGMVWWSWKDWFGFAKSLPVESQIIIFIWVNVLCVDCYTGHSFGWFGQWPSQLMQLGCNIIFSIVVDIVVIFQQCCCLGIQCSCSHGWCKWAHMWHIYWHTFYIGKYQFAHVAYIWHLSGIFVSGTYMEVAR